MSHYCHDQFSHYRALLNRWGKGAGRNTRKEGPEAGIPPAIGFPITVFC